jgi:hypothetical protein
MIELQNSVITFFFYIKETRLNDAEKDPNLLPFSVVV